MTLDIIVMHIEYCSITDIPREDYIDAEERVVNELKEINKPFIILLNSNSPYSEATKLALKEAKITKLDTGFIYNIEINYSDLENLKYFLKNNEINILKEEFFENVKLCVFVPKNKMDCFKFEKTNILKIEKDEKNHTKRC